MAPAERAQPRIVPLLAIDVRHGWALVLFESQIRWWALGRPLPGAADTEGDAIMRLAAVWLRRWLQ